MNSPQSASVSLWWEAARPRTLSAAVAPVAVATALAARDGFLLPVAAGTCLAFAVLVQIGTNYANDYFDYRKGGDNADRVGPRRVVAAGLISPATMKRVTLGVFVAAFVVGLGLLRFGGWPLLLVGLTSIACGVIYTGGPYPLAYHGWGDVFVFLFFGLIAVTMTYFVQAAEITIEACGLGVLIGALAANILVVNNYRDVATDRAAGKRTLVVSLGKGFARGQFALAHMVAIAMVGLLAGRGALHPGLAVFTALFAGMMGWSQWRTLRRATAPGQLIALLGTTGRYLVAMALLLSIGLLV